MHPRAVLKIVDSMSKDNSKVIPGALGSKKRYDVGA